MRIAVGCGFNALTFQPDVKQLKSYNLVSWYAAPLAFIQCWQQLILNQMEYMVCFYESVQTEERLYQSGEVIKVNQEEMFKWVEKAHIDKIKISIYTCTMVCDLS